MKKIRRSITIISLLALVTLLCLLIITLGCNTSKERTVFSMLSCVPEDAESFDFQDVTAMRENDAIDRFYENLEGDLWEFLRLEEVAAGIIDQKQYEEYGIYSTDVDYSLSLRGNYYILIIKGKFNFDEIIKELNTIGLESSEHLGVVIWKGYSTSIALTEDLIIMGNDEDIRDCIEVMKEDDVSMLHNQEMKGIVDRLEDAPRILCFHVSEEIGLIGDNVNAFGKSASMLDEDTIKITYVYMYINEFTNRNAFEEMEKMIEAGEVNEDITILDLYCDGNYQVMTFKTKDWLYYFW